MLETNSWKAWSDPQVQHLRGRGGSGNPCLASAFEIVDRRVNRALKFIATEFAELRSIPQLARRVNTSERTLQRVFKQETGTTIGSHLRRTRLEHAKELVVQTDEQIAQIGYRAGFSNPHHFSRAFRKAFGKTPTQVRQESVEDV